MKNATLFCLAALLLCACGSDPLSRKYTSETFTADMKEIVKAGKLTAAEAMLVSLYVASETTKHKSPLGKTYAEIVRDIRTREEEAARETAAAEAKIARNEKIHEVLDFKMKDVRIHSDEGSTVEKFTYVFTLTNKTNRDIHKFEGLVCFRDPAGNPVRTLFVQFMPDGYHKPVRAGSSTNFIHHDIGSTEGLTVEAHKQLTMEWKPQFLQYLQ